MALQTSVVQASPSSQPGAGPVQVPASHVSPVVHRLPSSHVVPSGAGSFRQPTIASHVSSVHDSPSSHAESFGVDVQPVTESHESAVHEIPSSHDKAGC